MSEGTRTLSCISQFCSTECRTLFNHSCICYLKLHCLVCNPSKLKRNVFLSIQSGSKKINSNQCFSNYSKIYLIAFRTCSGKQNITSKVLGTLSTFRRNYSLPFFMINTVYWSLWTPRQAVGCVINSLHIMWFFFYKLEEYLIEHLDYYYR